jgi:hypothetical protein
MYSTKVICTTLRIINGLSLHIGKYLPYQKMLGMEVLDPNGTNVLLYVQMLLDINLHVRYSIIETSCKIRTVRHSYQSKLKMLTYTYA